jgi:hypothetical protein
VPVNGPTDIVKGLLRPRQGLELNAVQPATHFTLTDTVAVEPPLSV